MIRKKQNGKKVWVTFTVSPVEGMTAVGLSGAWNEWSEEPMKQKKNGDFSLTKVLPAGTSFEFGYKLGNGAWLTDDDCAVVASPFGGENALLEL